jgi:hypothetical protein
VWGFPGFGRGRREDTLKANTKEDVILGMTHRERRRSLSIGSIAAVVAVLSGASVACGLIGGETPPATLIAATLDKELVVTSTTTTVG